MFVCKLLTVHTLAGMHPVPSLCTAISQPELDGLSASWAPAYLPTLTPSPSGSGRFCCGWDFLISPPDSDGICPQNTLTVGGKGWLMQTPFASPFYIL